MSVTSAYCEFRSDTPTAPIRAAIKCDSCGSNLNQRASTPSMTSRNIGFYGRDGESQAALLSQHQGCTPNIRLATAPDTTDKHPRCRRYTPPGHEVTIVKRADTNLPRHRMLLTSKMWREYLDGGG
jgi:hypothetical protein